MLLFHFHGGLVNEAAGLLIADAMSKHYGIKAKSVGVVWETGPIEAFQENLAELTQTDVFKKALSWILTEVLDHLGIAAGHAKGTESHEQAAIEASLQTDAGVRLLDAKLTASVSMPAAEGARGGVDEGLEDEELEGRIASEIELDASELRGLLEAEAPGARPINEAAKQDSAASDGIKSKGGGAALQCCSRK